MGVAYQNLILTGLPRAEIARLQPNLEPVLLPQNKVLGRPGEKVLYAYFPEEGMASIVVTMNNGVSVEVGIVGREGLVGLPILIWHRAYSHPYVHADSRLGLSHQGTSFKGRI